MQRVTVLSLCAVLLLAGGAGRGTQSTCDEPPLAIEDVEFYLKNYLPFIRLRQKIEACGVTFILDAAGEKRLRNAGGNDELFRLLATPANIDVSASTNNRRHAKLIMC